MMFALTRSYGLIGQRCIFKFDTRPVSRYVGREELLAEDIEAWKKSHTSVLIYAGTHAKRLQDRLLDSNHIVPIKEKLDRDIVPGEVLIIEQQLNHGFEYPELSLAVVWKQSFTEPKTEGLRTVKKSAGSRSWCSAS